MNPVIRAHWKRLTLIGVILLAILAFVGIRFLKM